MHIRMSLFENTVSKLGISIGNPFLKMAFIAFWKRALEMFIMHVCIYICIYTYSYMVIHKVERREKSSIIQLK